MYKPSPALGQHSENCLKIPSLQACREWGDGGTGILTTERACYPGRWLGWYYVENRLAEPLR